jgi:hypothetical protein
VNTFSGTPRVMPASGIQMTLLDARRSSPKSRSTYNNKETIKLYDFIRA